jgi:hypothetical protein
MRRSMTLAVAWPVAAGVATVAAWQGVAIVTNQVTDNRPAPFEAAEVQAALDEVATTTTASTAPPGSGATTTTTTGGTTSTTATTETTEVEPVTITYRMVGGTTALRFTPSAVTALFAIPNAGFEVDVDADHGNGVRVEFESESHRSRVEGWWDGGPQERTREDDDGG